MAIIGRRAMGLSRCRTASGRALAASPVASRSLKMGACPCGQARDSRPVRDHLFWSCKWIVAVRPIRETWKIALSKWADGVAQINRAVRYNMADGLFSVVPRERLLYIGLEFMS